MEQVEWSDLFPESGVILFESYRRTVLNNSRTWRCNLVGDDRLELLAVVDVRRDLAWIEAKVAEWTDA